MFGLLEIATHFYWRFEMKYFLIVLDILFAVLELFVYLEFLKIYFNLNDFEYVCSLIFIIILLTIRDKVIQLRGHYYEN